MAKTIFQNSCASAVGQCCCWLLGSCSQANAHQCFPLLLRRSVLLVRLISLPLLASCYPQLILLKHRSCHGVSRQMRIVIVICHIMIICVARSNAP